LFLFPISFQDYLAFNMAAIKPQRLPEQGEQAMIAGIMEGSPDAVGVAVIRLDCGCRKMAAVSMAGEPASKIIMYRDQAESVCAQCKRDNGDYIRMIEQFISWKKPEPEEGIKKMIADKVLGTAEGNA
jgi:hypothetical protein